MKIAVISLTENGRNISKKIFADLDGCVCYAFEKHCASEIPFTSLRELTAEIFSEYNALIYICACGTAVRVIAPNIVSKLTDPAVIAVDEQGKFAVSLLSGHIGGANAFAKKIAEIIGGTPVITTATDIGGKFSPDSFAAANNLHITDIGLAKEISAAVVNGEKVGFYSDYPCKNIPDIFSDNAEIGVCVSDNRTRKTFKKTLHLIPKNIVAGVGCRKNTSLKNLSEFIWRIMGENGISLFRICQLNTIDVKKDEAAVAEFANKLNIPANFYSAEQLMNVDGDFSKSKFVMKTVGADNVCERAAAISGGRIIITKQAENGITFAAAELSVDIDFEREIL